MKIEVIVCGAENINLVDDSSYELNLTADSIHFVSVSEMHKWFIVSNAEHSFCQTTTFEKYPAQNCGFNRTSDESHFSMIKGGQLQVLTHDNYTSERICIMAATIGKKFARKEVEIMNVCGHESIHTLFPAIRQNWIINGIEYREL
jgi:hypothetical protein